MGPQKNVTRVGDAGEKLCALDRVIAGPSRNDSAQRIGLQLVGFGISARTDGGADLAPGIKVATQPLGCQTAYDLTCDRRLTLLFKWIFLVNHSPSGMITMPPPILLAWLMASEMAFEVLSLSP